MSQAVNTRTADVSSTHPFTGVSVQPAQQAYWILYAGFIVLPIVAGVDKFSNLLTQWDAYLSPLVTRTLSISAHSFMMIAGVIEIVAGILVAFKPRIGSYIVMLWLWGIIINLLTISGFYDIALRDFGLSLAALAFARLSREFA